MKSATVNSNSLTEPVITSTSPYTTKLENDLKQNTPTSSDSNNRNFFYIITDLLKNIYFKILLLILILAFLGFNLFKYLADATGKTSNIIVNPIQKILKFFGYTIGETSKNIIGVGAKGTKLGVDVTSNAMKDTINIGENILGVQNKDQQSKKNQDLDKAISKPRKLNNKISTPEPDDAGSKTQSSKPNSKPGFCFIGEDRGFRSCIKVDDANMCMSGEIFPTKDICINPTLRE